MGSGCSGSSRPLVRGVSPSRDRETELKGTQLDTKSKETFKHDAGSVTKDSLNMHQKVVLQKESNPTKPLQTTAIGQGGDVKQP